VAQPFDWLSDYTSSALLSLEALRERCTRSKSMTTFGGRPVLASCQGTPGKPQAQARSADRFTNTQLRSFASLALRFLLHFLCAVDARLLNQSHAPFILVPKMLPSTLWSLLALSAPVMGDWPAAFNTNWLAWSRYRLAISRNSN
jgi:hypothetical protein